MGETGTRCSSLRATEQLDKLADDVIIEIELGVMRELVQRLEKLEAAHQRPVTGKGAIDRVLADDAARRGDTEHLVMLLRVNGVTRFKRAGDEIEIELRSGLFPEVGSAEWWRASTPEQLKEHRDRIGCIRATDCTCYVCQAEARQPHLAGVGADPAGEPKRCGACHEPEPGHKDPDDQPVEIDMAAVEEKLREQDAKRRGPAQ
jgi:hypothetical protein